MSDEERRWQLTQEERELISRHLDFYRSLDNGERPPETEAQRHFVVVCRCRTKAETIHETAYFKHRARELKRRSEVEAFSETINEFGERIPRPGWFTDEDWKRMRSQYLSNSD